MSQWLGQDHLCAPRDAVSPVLIISLVLILDSDDRFLIYFLYSSGTDAVLDIVPCYFVSSLINTR